LTKELNDLVVFDFNNKQFSSCSDTNENLKQEDLASPEPKRSTTQGNNPPMRMKTYKAQKGMSLSKKEEPETVNSPRLSTPTSVSMQNTFIIMNADDSFEQNSKLLPKNRSPRGTFQDAVKYTDLVDGNRPPPRDGHTACVDSQGFMYIFGGDRHQMPFNDLYMVKLE